VKLRITPIARRDMQEIRKYIADELQNPSAAKNILRKITAAYKRLPNMPYIGSPLSAIVDTPTDYRYLITGSYLIFYKVENPYVSVYRVLYGGRDYSSVLFGELSNKEI
jgi:addiction module RelE/StbE family toxin